MITLEAAAQAGVEAGRTNARVRHAHYYDAAFHRALSETGKVDIRSSLERIAAGVAYRALLADAATWSVNDAVRELLSTTGLGEVKEVLTDGDRIEVVLATSGPARARIEMFGTAKAPSCDITRGVLAGGFGAAFDKPYTVDEIACVAQGDANCRFVGRPASDATLDEPAPFLWPARAPAPAADRGFPAADALEPLVGDDHDSLPGASYGRLWAELYARATLEFEEEVPLVMGAKFANLPSVVLTEAAHLATFYSVGGLVRSAEWRELVAPGLAGREEWVHAIVALLDDVGPGDWRIRLLAPEQRFTVHLYDGYESLSHRALSGTTTTPRCYFARGVVAAIMNVLYAGDILSEEALTPSVYNRLFRSPMSFRAIETRCQAMGHPYCEFVANPLSPGLRPG